VLVGKKFLLQFGTIVSRALEKNKDVALVAKREKTWAWVVGRRRRPR